MEIVAIIPARMGSSRFPNKPLAKIHGYPMIEHVYKRVLRSKKITGAYIATCDEVIAETVEAFGGKAIMTQSSHERGTDRLAEASEKLGLRNGDVIVNVQGDEPMVYPQMIDTALTALEKNPDWSSVNLISPITTLEELEDKNQIKVVLDAHGKALFMSRQPIPSLFGKKDFSVGSHWKQVCIIPFRYETLRQFSKLNQTLLEQHESIDMMRLIQNGIAVGTAPYDSHYSHAVDTPDDLKKVEGLLSKDALFHEIFG